ncbi:hypothetical protein VCHA52P454_50280 [Vibrio chagasii]|nr:hypothetical protein VCHA52P454_50280 [Vibrio chagasii]
MNRELKPRLASESKGADNKNNEVTITKAWDFILSLQFTIRLVVYYILNEMKY